jgi:hypothetical protein
MRKLFYKFTLWLPTIVLMAPILARADLPAGNAVTIGDVTNIVAYFGQLIVIMSMTIAVICIVLSGILIMTSAGDAGRFKTGTTWLTNVAIGAGVALGAGVIINTVAAVIDRSFFCQVGFLGICIY